MPAKARHDNDARRFYNEQFWPSGREAREEFYLWVLDLLTKNVNNNNRKLLDVGCGAGRFLKVATEKGLKTYGIDISSYAIRMARKATPLSNICVGLATSLPWEDGSFDYVTSLGVLEHLQSVGKAVREIARVVRENGRVCLVVPSLFSLITYVVFVSRKGYIPTYQRTYLRSRPDWEEVIESNGLRIIKVVKCNWIPWTKYGFVYLLSRIFGRLIPLNLSHDFIFICAKS